MTESERLVREASCEQRVGKWEAAAALLEKAVELDPKNKDAWKALSRIHSELGDQTLADAAIREASSEVDRTEINEPAIGDNASTNATATATETSLRTETRGSRPWKPPPGVIAARPDGELRQLVGGLLLVPAGEQTRLRSRNSILHSGSLSFEAELRRRRGTQEQEPFEDDAGPVYRLRGAGMAILRAGKGRFTPLDLEEQSLYLRQTSVEAFHGDLSWDNGRLPGNGPAFVEFHGRGRVVVWTETQLVAVRIDPSAPASVALDALVGWIGTIVPLIEPNDGGPLIALCEGEGTVLLDPGVLQPD